MVAGVGGWRYWQNAQRVAAEAASERFDDANRLVREGKVDEADKASRRWRREGPAGYRLLAQFRAAAETGQARSRGGGRRFDAIADDTGLATACATSRACAPRCCARRAEPGARPGEPSGPRGRHAFRHTAREMLGLTALKRGHYEEAGRWFDQLTTDPDTPQNLRQRIEVYAALVAGGPVTVTEAKPEPAAPPPPITR